MFYNKIKYVVVKENESGTLLKMPLCLLPELSAAKWGSLSFTFQANAVMKGKNIQNHQDKNNILDTLDLIWAIDW